MLREDVALEKCSEMSIILVLDNETFFYLKIKKSFFIFLEVIFSSKKEELEADTHLCL